MKKLLSLLAFAFLFGSAIAQVCPVSFSYIKIANTPITQHTVRTFEPCLDYATQIAFFAGIAIDRQQYPGAIFLTGNSLTNIHARGASHGATKHYYSVW